eukprot:SM000116S24213  [mRNA]  locus=s116:98365:101727:+ [translate_table: standard]
MGSRMTFTESHESLLLPHSFASRFTRGTTQFRSHIEAGGEFPPEAGRYHLVVARSCPWAHRALLLRSLKGLQDVVSVGLVHPDRNDDVGWHFPAEPEVDPALLDVAPDAVLGARLLSEYYLASDAKYTGSITVPVLWDKISKRIVSNESAEIIMLFNSAFGPLASGPDYYPAELRAEVDEVNDFVYHNVNNGVYKCGFAKSQEAYDEAVGALFTALDQLEERLGRSRYLVDTSSFTEITLIPTLADWRLFVTLIRFDAVYYEHFKCNVRHIRDYPKLHGYMLDLYSDPRVAATVSIPQIKSGYYLSHNSINPKGIVPKGGDPFIPAVPFARRILGVSKDGRGGAQELQGNKEVGRGAPSPLTGAFVRPDSKHRNWIMAEGSSSLKAEDGRYHLYVANNCPWCHRTILTRALLGLQDVISMDVCWFKRDPERGWQFNPDEPGCTPETVNGGKKFVREIYELVGSTEKSVPVLWDKKTQSIVSNESADIIRMLAQQFKAFHAAGSPDLCPETLLPEIDEVNAWIYDSISNGAYKAGFASQQAAYELAFDQFYEALDRVELMLSQNKYLLGDAVTEADVRLFPTIFRLDYVYYIRFMLNKAMLVEEYPNLQRWLMDFYDLPGVKEACNIRHCKAGYFGRSGNNIVPKGPQLSYSFMQ